MCSSSWNACANGYAFNSGCSLELYSCCCLLQVVGIITLCSAVCWLTPGLHVQLFFSALPLLNQVISVSQPPSNPYSLHPSFFFFFILLAERTENTLQHHTCFPQGQQCLGKYLRWAEKLDFPCLYSVTAQLATREVFLECDCRSTPAPRKILSGFISPWQIDKRKRFACVPHFYHQNSDSLECFVKIIFQGFKNMPGFFFFLKENHSSTFCPWMLFPISGSCEQERLHTLRLIILKTKGKMEEFKTYQALCMQPCLVTSLQDSRSSVPKTKHAGVTQDYWREPEQTIACTDTVGQRFV